MLVDAHAHLDHYAPDVLERALDDIERLRIVTLAVSMDADSYTRACAIATRSPLVVPAFGVHPRNAPAWAGRLDELDQLIRGARIIGEVGLDHKFVEDESRYPSQRVVFERFLRAASRRKLILNLHTAGAEHEVLGLLERYDIRRSVVHWYAGPLELLEGFVELDTYFTVGVEVASSPDIQAIARAIPDDRLLTETDNPDGVRWLRGDDGMPAALLEVVETLAALRGVDTMTIEQRVQANFVRLYGKAAQLDRAVFCAAHTGGRPAPRP